MLAASAVASPVISDDANMMDETEKKAWSAPSFYHHLYPKNLQRLINKWRDTTVHHSEKKPDEKQLAILDEVITRCLVEAKEETEDKVTCLAGIIDCFSDVYIRTALGDLRLLPLCIDILFVTNTKCSWMQFV